MSVVVDGRTKLTYEEYRHFPDDGLRHEIVDGMHVASPAPGTDHQNVSRHVQFALYRQIELTGRGQVFDAPVDVELGETDVVQPDLVIVLDEHRDIVLRSRIRGVPDLIVEILSPSTSERDRTLKLALYETHRVPEYWVVDTESYTVYRYRLGGEGVRYEATDASDAAGYGEPEVYREEITYAGATVDLTDVWRRM